MHIINLKKAGISTNAKIPDFRSESFGLYNRLSTFNLPYPTAVFELEYFKVYIFFILFFMIIFKINN